MRIPPTPLTPVRTFDNPNAPRIERTAKALAITQIALLALSIVAAASFVIAAAVTLNAFLLIGAGICGAIALGILGSNLCCRSMLKREESVFTPRHESHYTEQAFVQGFQKRTPLITRSIPWPESRIPSTRTTLNTRVLPRQR